VYCIALGNVTIRRSDAGGNELILAVAGRGRVLGYRAYAADEPHATEARANGQVLACFIPRRGVDRLLRRDARLGDRLRRQLAKDLRQSHEARLVAAYASARARLAHALVGLARRHAVARAEGEITVALPLRRRELAAMIGARPETVSRAIGELHRRGLAQFEDDQVVIPNVARLMDEYRG
jgi:CRP/FNR family transcriptional regulator